MWEGSGMRCPTEWSQSNRDDLGVNHAALPQLARWDEPLIYPASNHVIILVISLYGVNSQYFQYRSNLNLVLVACKNVWCRCIETSHFTRVSRRVVQESHARQARLYKSPFWYPYLPSMTTCVAECLRPDAYCFGVQLLTPTVIVRYHQFP